MSRSSLDLEPAPVPAVRELAARLGLDEQVAAYAAHRWDGAAGGLPVAHVDDFSELPFLGGVAGVSWYQHRARVRALTGDLVVSVLPFTEGYEAYCRERLGLGTPELLLAPEAAGPLAVARAVSEPRPFARLKETARAAGGLRLHPFMGIEAIWELAARLAREAGVPVQVIAPPPPVTWLANDKALFDELVRGVLGDAWLVEGGAATEPAALAARLGDLARRHRRVALKRLRCVSGMGNGVFDAAELVAGGDEAARRAVDEFLEQTAWDGREPVMAVAWVDAVCSPSTQLWIPPAGAGRPRLDGIYEQLLVGRRQVFAGSRPSTLPAAVDRALASGSLAVGEALQALGYAGRCSFDLLVSGDLGGDFEVHFVECNGRWGGTSLPMHLVDRLIEGPRPPYRAQDVVHRGLAGAGLEEILEALGDELYDAASGRGRYVLYNVGPLAEHGKLDVVAFGDTLDEAEAALAALPKKLGLS